MREDLFIYLTRPATHVVVFDVNWEIRSGFTHELAELPIEFRHMLGRIFDPRPTLSERLFRRSLSPPNAFPACGRRRARPKNERLHAGLESFRISLTSALSHRHIRIRIYSQPTPSMGLPGRSIFPSLALM